jgi:hypothetical protein
MMALLAREIPAFQTHLQLRFFTDVGRDPPRLVAGESAQAQG